MELQNKILNQYLVIYGKKSFKAMAQDTGIQLTRIFRLFNGSPMKLSEYQIFEEKIRTKFGAEKDLEAIAKECMLVLGKDSIKELEECLQRKLELWKLTQKGSKKISHQFVS